MTTVKLHTFVRGTAVLSPCGTYRYDLYRRARTKNTWVAKPLLFVMLNPSTADSNKNDPTVLACMGHSEILGYNGIRILNLYAYRSTNPRGLLEAIDPVGPDNDKCLRLAFARYTGDEIICAWGNHATPRRAEQVMAMALEAGCKPTCFGVNRTGMPKHPLYIARGTIPVPYTYTTEDL